MTTICQPLDEMADVAAELLLRRIDEGNGAKPEQIVCATTLVERAST